MNEEEKELLIYLIERRLIEIKFSTGMNDFDYKQIETNYNVLIRKINDLKAD